MKDYELAELEHDLRVALTLKGEDLRLTLGGSDGERLQDDFLGVSCDGELPSDAFSTETDLAKIDLDRFQIAKQVRDLYAMLDTLSLGLASWRQAPDADTIRQEALDFLDRFLSTLPSIALGAWDATYVRNGVLRTFFEECSAWANLVEAIQQAFQDDGDLYVIRVTDLAHLSGLELRTMRNKVGPTKPIRTTTERNHRNLGLGGSSFVGVNTLDALNWLSGRQRMVTSLLDPEWVEHRLEEALQPSTIGRSPIVLALINEDPLPEIARRLNWSERKLKAWADVGPTDSADDAKALAELAGLWPDRYAAKCASLHS